VKISIIIPALNEALRLSETVARAWQAGATEVIVVDGGSSDATWEVAGSVACRRIRSARGRARQQNAGAAVAEGDVLLFQHADNWLVAGGAEQIRWALRDPRVAGGAFRQRIEAQGIGYRWLEWGNAWRVRWLGSPYGDQNLFLRRDVFFELGGFPDVPIMEDVLLMRRLRRRGWPVLLPGPVHVSPRRWQEYGLLRQTLRNWSLLAGLRLGIPTQRLARWYPRHDTNKRNNRDHRQAARDQEATRRQDGNQ
jgi:rSAM/selenodomain-associated transferase 2